MDGNLSIEIDESGAMVGNFVQWGKVWGDFAEPGGGTLMSLGLDLTLTLGWLLPLFVLEMGAARNAGGEK